MDSESLLNAHELELLRFQAQRLPGYRAHGTSQLSGAQLSLQRGAGLELEDLRPYQFGDDVRHIAWRTSARSGRPISKVFRAERRQRILLLVEQHPGMGFATRGELKATVASRTTALISFAALRQGAEIGGMLVGQKTRFFQPASQLDQTLLMIGAVNRLPRRQPYFNGPQLNPPSCKEGVRGWWSNKIGQSISKRLNVFASPPPSPLLQGGGVTHQSCLPIDPANSIKQLQMLAQRHDTIYLISDFQHWSEEPHTPLAQLAEWHNLHALQIIDQGEQQLTAVGKLRIRSPFDGSELIIDTDNAQLRRQYATSMAAKQAQLEQLFRRSGVKHHHLYTDADILNPLAQAL